MVSSNRSSSRRSCPSLGCCTRPAGVTDDPLGLTERPSGDAGDLGGEPVDLRLGLPGASPQRPGDLLEPTPSRSATIPEAGAAGRTAGLDPPDEPTQPGHGLLQQVGIGRVVDVGLHHGGIHPQLAAPQQLVLGELVQQRAIELLDDLRAGAADQLD
jgi:hypothetical protein